MCWRKVGVLALLAMAMAFVHAQEGDEFDVVEPQEAAAAPTPSRTMPAQDFATLAKQLIPFQNPDYLVVEASSWGFGILFLLLFFVGKAQNRKIADKWVEEAEPVLSAQFSYTGSSVENGIGLIEESRSNFKYFCTGRRFLTRFVADLELKSRHDLISRVYRVIVPTSDFLTIDVGLHGEGMDPFILGISKKLGFTALSKIFPELVWFAVCIETAKQVPVKEVPESMWVATDCTEIPKAALTQSIQASLNELEDFLEYIVITDMNKHLIIGMPKTQKHVLRVRFKLQVGSKKLDIPKALQLVFALVDGAGATIKLSPNAKHSAIKRRLKIKQAAEALASQENEIARRQAELNEKKNKEYESLSYEEQQKVDAKNEKRATRKRFNRKASIDWTSSTVPTIALNTDGVHSFLCRSKRMYLETACQWEVDECHVHQPVQLYRVGTSSPRWLC
ncbi:Coiled-coil domain-containing protein 47 [Phytophthora pseudosyringae]|uniref:Coiled-coil domain-containing protein 47 n=1 Tax=Phytophthora pseudosyringae TaxID=221518 RepID=A0A8T1WAX7_9STRA|nr:Coiled-coil domain-containing protein 47 [Phytophthora pseudosyringae]